MVTVALFIALSHSRILQTPDIALYEGIGKYRRSIKTKSQAAYQYDMQGLAMLYSFDYNGASRSFSKSITLDPDQVFGYWGKAMTYGNTINWSNDKDDHIAAVDELEKAKSHRAFGSPVENDLVDALVSRFSPSGPDRKLDIAYSNEMRHVYSKYPNDPDVASLFAESILNLRPWKQWTLDGRPEEGTEEAMKVLRHALDLNQNHPQALHLWIHTLEGSKEPQRALPEAYRLLNLQPDLSHMQHMPSHIFDRAGKYRDAIESNLKSVSTAKRTWGTGGRGKTLDFAHGRHMLIHAAAMRGQSELALQHWSQMFDGIPGQSLDKLGELGDFYQGMKYMLLVRFGKWQDILNEPTPPERFVFTKAMKAEATGIAYAAMKNPTKAREAQQEFLAASEKSPSGGVAAYKAIYRIAGELLEGEILVSEGKVEAALEHLRQAVAAEDKLPYTEPPDWIQPTRHTLGAALVDAGEYQEAIDVYKEDLRQHPENGWALYGLYRANVGLGKTKDASKALSEFKVAWVDADLITTSSCLCMPEKKKG
ncbi:MAG TPA: tetratricopeptide repeat protein [Fimbriimonadaceae bacterium]|nr:tetratricopeptide repeat protein [Fimbriimonadaceae bacterium]